jgi:ubiquinone/menaquinone biosynthesis C-methylase UbiE
LKVRSPGYGISGHFYDFFMAPSEWAYSRRLRRRTLQDISGRVLEIGVGTGLNLPLYDSAENVIGLDRDQKMMRRAKARLRRAPVPAHLLIGDGQRLPFADRSFDAVVATLVFCSIPDPHLGLDEVTRVLHPDGRLVLIEHVRSPRPRLARLQQRLTPWWKRVSGGCHLDRPTYEFVVDHGFRVQHVTFLFGKHVIVLDALAPDSGSGPVQDPGRLQ